MGGNERGKRKMRRNQNKLNRYGTALGISVIAGQTFREKPKKHRLSAEMSKLMERNGQNGNGKSGSRTGEHH